MMDAHVLRVVLEHAVKAHPDIVDARPTTTIYSDRLALAVEDRDGQLWRVQVLREPVGGVS